MSKELISRIEELRNQIRKHDYEYYVLNKPSVSDREYDKLYNELEELENKYPKYVTSDSPTQRVGSDLTKEFSPVNHTQPMLSLSNTYSEEEVYAFDKRVKESLDLDLNSDVEYVAELKIDGVSVSLCYKNGRLVYGATRGDGFTGEDVTPNIKTIKSVPLVIENKLIEKYGLINFEVRGEIFMTLDGFTKLNLEREKNSEKLFANPRNSAAGTIKLQNPALVASRPLDIFVYYLLAENAGFKQHSENLDLLKKLGFKVNSNYKLCRNITEVLRFCKQWETKRGELPYEIDGVVIKINNLNYQKRLGSIAKSPRWAVAYKFKAIQAQTKLNKITWQVGRTGALTPVAELDPVFLAGSTISRATLHNIDEIRRKDIREGDIVIIEKGGDVIPKVVEVVLSEAQKRFEPAEMPSYCPVCNSKLFKPENEVALYCENSECSAQVKGRILHFADRGAMDIEGLGEAVVNIFVDKGYLKSYADIYYLKERRSELVSLERFGEKKVDNLFSAIERSKDRPFGKVLFALGIRYVGSGAAQKIASYFNSIDELITADENQIEEIYEIGPSISRSIKKFFADEHNINLIEKMKKAGLNFQSEKPSVDTNILGGKSFVVTGTLELFTREGIKDKIISLGGKVLSSISKNTDFLIAGESAGSKLDKAEKLGVKILSETEFLKMIEQ